LGHSQTVEYATLSHCWGQEQIITTTKNTFKSRQRGIPWECLSKTFREAIYITHKLGYRYIWIDSLCIIQDDKLDWEIESKKMASTYQNSVFTIAASKSADGNGGCFTSTPGLTGEEPYHSDGLSWRVPLPHVYEPPPRWHGFDSSEYEWPLILRAWTLQEELLSSRVIYYGPYELLWQCSTTFNCQCGEFRRAMPFSHDMGQLNKVEFSAVLNMDLREHTTVVKYQRSLEIQWAHIVEQYSMRQLTRETDRFPALSGLAKRIQAAGPAPLVAGIPAINVLPWLLWESLSSKKRHTEYIAPSWSWASVNCTYKINFINSYLTQPGLSVKLEPIAQVVDIAAEPAGLDPTGALKSGSLTLYSSVATVKFIYSIEVVFGAKAAASELHMRNPDGSEDRILTPSIDYDEDKQNLNGRDLLFVLICRTKTSDPDDHGSTTYGLVLGSAGGSLYQRIGCCGFSSEYELRERLRIARSDNYITQGISFTLRVK
jgi:Heterokaryon incompatibility protein (HET)